MFFNKKEEIKGENLYLIKVTALLIHAAKIDEKYTDKEEEIIKKTLLNLGANKNDLDLLIINASKIEEETNQILEFTKEIKNLDEKKKNKNYKITVENYLFK